MAPDHRRPIDDIPDDVVERMIETLVPFVSPERRARISEVVSRRTREVVLVLEDIYDDHNASAVLRTAEALGIAEIHVIEPSLRFEINAKTSSGAYRWLDVVHHRDAAAAYADLRARGYQIWASAVRGAAVPVDAIDPAPRIALVFGNEHAGLTEGAARGADGRFTVPMAGFVESLNISVAAALSAWEVLARKRRAGVPLSLPPAEARRLEAEWLGLSVRAARELLARRGLPYPSARRQTTRFVRGGEPETDGDPGIAGGASEGQA